MPKEVSSNVLPSHELWRLFSSSTVRDLANVNGGEVARSLITKIDLPQRSLRKARLSDVYESVFMQLMRKKPPEYAYKNALLQRNIFGKAGSKRARVFFEFRAGTSKLDALVARESMHAFEIKTEFDHFRRLPGQLSDYTQRFAHVWVFVSERHASRIEAQVGSDIGVAFMTAKHTFEVIREASRQVKNLRSEKILECLRRSEYLDIVKEFGFQEIEIPNTRLFGEAMRFASKLNPQVVHEATLAQLRGRMRGLSARTLATIPLYLRAAVVAANLGDSDVGELLQNLDSRVQRGGIR